jgi:hypothetical protein
MQAWVRIPPRLELSRFESVGYNFLLFPGFLTCHHFCPGHAWIQLACFGYHLGRTWGKTIAKCQLCCTI